MNSINPKVPDRKGKLKLPFLLFIGSTMILTTVVVISLVVGRQLQDARVMSVRTFLPTITLDSPANSPTITTTPAPNATAILTPTATLIPQCDVGQAVWTILLIAKDYEEGNKEGVSPDDYTTGFADAIRLVRVDFRDGSIKMLAIPRDLIVSIPGLEEYGIYQERLKMAYAYGYQYDYPGLGSGLLVDTLQSNFGFRVDQSVTINFTAFSELVETLGGLEISIPAEVGSFSAGEYVMDGEQALEYARLRDKAGEDTSDLSRIERQTQILFALREKVLSPAVLPKAPELIAEFMGLVSTDLNMLKMNQLLCLSQNISLVDTIEMDERYFTIQIDAFGYERLIPNYLEIRKLAEEFQIR